MNKLLKTFFAATFLIIGFFAFDSFALAADRYWVGGTANWDGTAGTKWATTSGGAGGAAIPGASDDVYFDANSGANTITITTSVTINSWHVVNGFTGTITHNGSVTVTVSNGAAAAGPSNKVLDWTTASVWVYTPVTPATSVIAFGRCTTATPQEINFGDKTIGTISLGTINAGSWKFTSDVLHGTNGTFVAASASTIDLNGKTFNATSYAFNAAITLTAGTSNITMTGNSATFAGGGETFYNLTITGNGTKSITSANTFNNLTITGTANKTDTVALGANQVVNGTFTVTGNSDVNRIMIASSLVGTQRTITSAANTISRADFRDIVGAGAASWDLSAITGNSGDAGGNSGITFTSAQTNYWVGGAGNWDAIAEWASSSGGAASSGRVPLPQDNATFDRNSFTAGAQSVVQNMPRMGKNIDWTDVTNGSFTNPTWNISQISQQVYGSITMISSITIAGSPTTMTFMGRAANTLTTAGRSIGSVTIDAPGGSLTLQDAMTLISNGIFTIASGTFDANDFAVTCLGAGSSGTTTRTLNMGNGTWTLSGTGSAWNFATVTNLTLNEEGSTIVVSNTTTTGKTFAGGGETYSTVTFAGQNITTTGNNTYATMNVNNAGFATGLLFTGASTSTITTLFTTNATTTAARAIATSTNASIFELKYTGVGTVCVDYMDIARSLATPGSTWYAGANSLNSGNNSGWTFSACPAVGGGTDQTMIIIID